MGAHASDGGRAKAGTALRCLVADARRFINDELWDRDLTGLPRMRRFVFSLSRVGIIVVKGFVADKCSLQASALTYITLMSMVPVLALALAGLKGLRAQDKLMEIIGLERLVIVEQAADAGSDAPPAERVEFAVVAGGRLDRLPAHMQEVVKVLFGAVENTDLGTLGVVGLCLLFWTVLKAMGRVELSFNMIWGLKAARPFFRKVADYISIVVVVPILMLAATSVNTMLASNWFTALLQGVSGPLYNVYLRIIGFSGLVGIVLAFGFLYSFMPNTRVRPFAALMAGIVGGLGWYVWQRVYFESQSLVASKGAIYGTFAAIPLFLLWLYVSWVIVLFGAEVGFAVQNYRTFTMESEASRASLAVQQALGLVVTYEVCSAFREGGAGWASRDFGLRHAVPTRLLSSVLFTLTQGGILVAVADQDGRYVPGRDIGCLTLADVEDAMRGNGRAGMKRMQWVAEQRVARTFAEHYETFRERLARVSFRELVESAA